MERGRAVSILTWDSAGNLTSEFSLSNGKRTGVLLGWYENGGKRSERVYVDDLLVSEQSWDEQGNPIR